MSFINQHSFSLLSAVALMALAVFLLRDGVQSSDLMALGALVLGLGLAYLLLRPGTSTLNEAEAVQSEIGSGLPVLLEFQSLY